MPKVQVQHVIFTRVEREYSPKRVSGYQIVYQSPSLGKETVQIEKHLQCFQPGNQKIDRYQFFRTENDQAVMAKSVPLFRPDREVIDRDQRNAFLAHALVMNAVEFAKVRNDPFAVFDATEQSMLCASSVERMVSYLKQSPPEVINVPIRRHTHSDNGWSNDEWKKLYELGLQAPTLVEQKKSLLMLTDEDEMYVLLRTLLFLLYPYERGGCTFDTFADSCVPAAGTYWAVGCRKQVQTPGFLPIRLSDHSVNVKVEGSGASVTLYSKWLRHALETCTGLNDISEEVDSAQIIATAFLNGTHLPEAPLNGNALQNFYEANLQSISQVLFSIVAAFFEKPLAEEIYRRLYGFYTLQELLSVAAQRALPRASMAWIIYLWRLNESPEFDYWDELLKFSKGAGYLPLLLMTSLKAHSSIPFSGYEELRIKALSALASSKQLTPTLTNLLEVRDRPSFSASGRNVARDSVTGSSRTFELTDEEFLDLVSALVKSNLAEALNGLFEQRLTNIKDKKILHNLAKIVKKSNNIPINFRRAVESYK